MPDDEIPACCFDEWAESNSRRARKRETAAPITADLLNALDDAGLEGRTLLDVGCGTGDLALAALGRGASTVSGFDLGPGAIANARALAKERGLAERATFEVGDGSELPLPRADVVVLNRVVCCYPSADALLTNTLGAAERVFAFTAPVDRGVIGVCNRILGWLGNRWYALRSKKFRGFRVFLHDLSGIEARIIDAGFAPKTRQQRRLVWDLRVYAREAQ
jgi:SAM-dependent methyltransferase